MSAMASDNTFFSALQPNTSVTTYGLPSEIQLGNGSSVSDAVARERRVQQQVQMRMAEKSTLPRQNGSASHYTMSGKCQQVSTHFSLGATWATCPASCQCFRARAHFVLTRLRDVNRSQSAQLQVSLSGTVLTLWSPICTVDG